MAYPSPALLAQRERFELMMRRFVRESDAELSDDAMVREVMKRYEADRRLPLIDVSE